jgi:hypothetical protein
MASRTPSQSGGASLGGASRTASGLALTDSEVEDVVKVRPLYPSKQTN